jgi:hypothetical protein
MKTTRDLKALYHQETGHYTADPVEFFAPFDAEYAKWLEDKLLELVNEEQESFIMVKHL